MNNKLLIMQARKAPVILDKLDRFIFFPNNKVCQTSIARVVLAKRAIVRKDDETQWVKKFSEIDAEYFSCAFTFTVVRNPYDRAVSAFTYLQGIGKIDPKINFANFCANILRHQGTSFNPHFDPQSDGLFCEGRLIPEFVARFESIENDWRRIAASIDGAIELPHKNQSKRARNYSVYYDDYSHELIADLYAEDLDNFGYKFETSSGG